MGRPGGPGSLVDPHGLANIAGAAGPPGPPAGLENALRRLLDFLRTDDIPTLSRASYQSELRYFLFWGMVVGAIEGNIAGIVAKKTFDAPDWLTSVIWALPVSANLTNFAWGALLRGRPMVTSVRVLTVGVALLTASLALVPPEAGPIAAFAFALQVALVHIVLSGLLSARVSIWAINYPKTLRARITGRLQTVRMLLLLLANGAIAWLFDRDPLLYRWIYPSVAAVGLLALLPLSSLRIRRPVHESTSAGGAWRAVVNALRDSRRILRQNRPFGRYMVAQFAMGSANFFTDAALITVLAGELALSYFQTSLLMFLGPTLVMLLSIRFWAEFFDRVGVVRFRVLHSMCWTVSYAFIAAAMIAIDLGGSSATAVALTLLALGRVVNGACRGGGTLAWSIGHLDFAPPHEADLYTGVHVGLTGLRGLLIPPISAMIYAALGSVSFVFAIGLSLVALVLFRRMRDDQPPPGRAIPLHRAAPTASAEPDQTRPPGAAPTTPADAAAASHP